MKNERKDKDVQDDELIMDTSKMSQGQREAMEIAEAAREKEWAHKSFVAQLFMGNFDFSMISPFPEQSEDDKKTGDEFVAQVSKYLSENLDPDDVDATGKIPQKVIENLFAMGVFAMKVPREYNGLGLTQVNYNRVMMMIASYCASTAVLVSAHQSIGVPQPLKMFGTDEQKKKYLPRFRKNAISAFALTEPDVGSDPARMKTEAAPTEDGKHYLLNGVKQWCTNAPIADIFVVMAKTPPKVVKGKERQQITAFIVEKEYPGVEVVQRCEFMGLAGMENGIVKFTNVKVPAENILLGEGRGLKMALATLNIGRLTLPAACTGAAKQCLSIARRFAGQRVQWGAPIGRHEFGCRKLAFIASTTFAMEAMTWICSGFVDQEDRDIRMEAAMAKLFCSEASWKIADLTVQLLGGRGYEKAASMKARGEPGYPVERIMRDCRINSIIEGTSEILKLFIAREALDKHVKLVAGLVKKKASIPERIGAFGNLMKFYSLWYPAQWVGGLTAGSYSEMESLAEHVRYVERTSRKLALTFFHRMAVYQDRLECKQEMLGHLVEVGMELFAMAGVCSYARSGVGADRNDGSPVELADFFCREAARRIEAHFRAIRGNDHRKMNAIANAVLDNKLEWLEKGIVRIAP